MLPLSGRWARACAFVRPFLLFCGLGLLLLQGVRLALTVTFFPRLHPMGELPLLWLTGLRFDVLFLCYAIAPAWVLACGVPPAAERAIKTVLLVYLSGLMGLMTFLECATWSSLQEYGSRPEALFLEFLHHGHELFGMLLGGFLVEAIAALIVICLVLTFTLQRLRRALRRPWPSWGYRLLALPLGGALLFIGARSSFGHRPANLSTAAFSQNHLHNELALNSTYTLLYAGYRLKHATEQKQEYGAMSLEESLAIVKQAGGFAEADFVPREDGRPSTRHRALPVGPAPPRPPNVVIILLESFGAEYTGRLGGTRLTPHFDRLAGQGLAFDQLFSTGTRTSRAIEAVLSGFFPTPARSVLKLGLAQRGFFTAADLLRRAGYRTHFIYGGEANFDEMKAFFLGNGVQEVWDQGILQQEHHAVGVWGIHDEDLFAEADRIFKQQGDQPFFALVLSTSNHSPFDYPVERIDPDPAFPVQSHENAIKYTDHALGQFFARAAASPYFAHTLFLVVADHGTRVSGDQLIPLNKFHIPGFIYGPPDRVPRETIPCLASQVDLLPTLLALTGREWVHPALGRNLLALPPTERADPHAGRALLQYERHFGYWHSDQLVILRPDLPAAQFHVETVVDQGANTFRLNPQPVDPILVRDALGHSVLPSWLYRERLYGTP